MNASSSLALNTSSNATVGIGNPEAVIGASNIIAATFVGLLIILTLGGNFVVCASFYTFRDLRTICNYFIISLSVSDILVALIAMPFWFTVQINNNEWRYGPELKSFWDCMDILCGTASIMNLMAVSFDRQLAITSPFTYPKVLTKCRAICIIVFVWAYATTIACIRLADWPFPAYLHFNPTFSFFLPLALMVIMYARIYLVARYQARRIGKNYATDIKAAKTIAVVIGVFAMCWCPLFVIILVFAHHGWSVPVPLQIVNLAKWLEYLNSGLNPIIYTCLNRTYRRAFRKLFARCRRKRRDSESSSASTWINAERKSITQMSGYQGTPSLRIKALLLNGRKQSSLGDVEEATDV